MSIETQLWRRLPVRGGGHLVFPRLERRAAAGPVTAAGPFGSRVLVDPANPPEVSVYLWGTYAPEVIFALGRVSQLQSTSIDVGASCGVLSVVMGRLDPRGQVIAIEPAPIGRGRIKQQAELNQLDLVAVNAAVGSGRGADDGGPTVDQVVAEHAAHPVSVIKINTEGTEPRVLRGASATLRASRPTVIFDHCPDGWARHGESPAAVAELLAEAGYELFAPVLRPRPSWNVAPIIAERFGAVSLASMADGTLAGGHVVALPAGDDGAVRRRRLLA